jgi:hypothetical protein
MPILPGKTEIGRAFTEEILGSRKAEYDDFQRRQGVEVERYFLQESPDGDVVIVTGEGTFTDPQTFVDLDRDFDRWFVDKVEEITGVQFMDLEGGSAELLGEWRP